VEKKVNITINTNIWKVVKSKAPLEDKTVNQWVVDAINEKLAKYRGGTNG
jgi:predicted HicB family RNase H-like nuclease